MAYRFKDRICTVEIEGRTASAVERLDVLKYIQVETAAFTDRFADVHTKQ